MEEIGVTAVVEGLSSFVSDMDKIQSSIESIRPPASILQDAFTMLGDAAGKFASWVGDVLTYTLGGLLKDAIESVVSMMGEMITKTIEAGNEFQSMTLRLNGMNLDALIKSGVDYNTATTKSIELTKEQLSWLQKLAAATPYDNTDISQTYSLARSYGFTDEEARRLTEDTANFSSAMGLTGDTLERIIRNFGQMRARGKITGTELRDLARGAFLPLDDILGRIAEKMGITTEALSKLISKPGGGVPEEFFITAFQEMIAQEPRFQGAAERMARTFKAASDNVMDLVTSFGGLNIVAPIMDVIGGRIADFMDQFIKVGPAGQEFTDLGKKLLDASVNIGKALVDIVNGIFGLLPSSKDLATGLVEGLQGIAGWLQNNKDGIISKIQDIVASVKNFFDVLLAPNAKNATNMGMLAFLKDLYDQLFVLNPGDKITGFQELQVAIQAVGSAIGEVLGPMLQDLDPKIGETKNFVANLVIVLFDFANWIRENQELIRMLIDLFIAFVVIQTATNLLWGLIGGLVAFGAGILSVLVATGALVAIFGTVIAIVTVVTAVFKLAQLQFSNFAIGIQFGITLILGYFNNMETTIRSIISRIDTAWRSGNWAGIGWAIISGVADGISRNVGLIVSAARTAALSAYNAAKAALGIRSPSTMFSGIGENIMLGMAQGIASSAGIAVGAMQKAVGSVSFSAMATPMSQYTNAPSTISNSYQSNNTYNLAINSQAQTEQVAADFGIMQSLAGV